MNKKFFRFIAFLLLGLILGLGLAVVIYGRGYGYWRYILWQGVFAYGLLGLLLGCWHGWLAGLTGQKWRLWKKGGLALIGDVVLTILLVVGEDMSIGHQTLLGSLIAAEVALTDKWIDIVCGILLVSLLLTHKYISASAHRRQKEE